MEPKDLLKRHGLELVTGFDPELWHYAEAWRGDERVAGAWNAASLKEAVAELLRKLRALGFLPPDGAGP